MLSFICLRVYIQNGVGWLFISERVLGRTSIQINWTFPTLLRLNTSRSGNGEKQTTINMTQSEINDFIGTLKERKGRVRISELKRRAKVKTITEYQIKKISNVICISENDAPLQCQCFISMVDIKTNKGRRMSIQTLHDKIIMNDGVN